MARYRKILESKETTSEVALPYPLIASFIAQRSEACTKMLVTAAICQQEVKKDAARKLLEFRNNVKGDPDQVADVHILVPHARGGGREGGREECDCKKR